jgi:hypothetical protein
MTPFEQGRVYARGWSAGKKAIANSAVDLRTLNLEKLNPYEEPAARERWSTAFSDAVKSSQQETGGQAQSKNSSRDNDSSPNRHRFRLGQAVAVRESKFEQRSAETFQVSRLLPIESGVVRYRITSMRDRHERVVEESRLVLTR